MDLGFIFEKKQKEVGKMKLQIDYFAGCNSEKVKKRLKLLTKMGYSVYIGKVGDCIDRLSQFDYFICLGKEFIHYTSELNSAILKREYFIRRVVDKDFYSLREIAGEEGKPKWLAWFPDVEGKCDILEIIDFISLFEIEVDPDEIAFCLSSEKVAVLLENFARVEREALKKRLLELERRIELNTKSIKADIADLKRECDKGIFEKIKERFFNKAFRKESSKGGR